MEKKFLASGHYFSIKACWRLKKRRQSRLKCCFVLTKLLFYNNINLYSISVPHHLPYHLPLPFSLICRIFCRFLPVLLPVLCHKYFQTTLRAILFAIVPYTLTLLTWHCCQNIWCEDTFVEEKKNINHYCIPCLLHELFSRNGR